MAQDVQLFPIGTAVLQNNRYLEDLFAGYTSWGSAVNGSTYGNSSVGWHVHWSGPPWLLLNESESPPRAEQVLSTDLEIHKFVSCVCVVTVEPCTSKWCSEVSSLSKFIRVLAYMYRVSKNFRIPADRRRKDCSLAVKISAGQTFLYSE